MFWSALRLRVKTVTHPGQTSHLLLAFLLQMSKEPLPFQRSKVITCPDCKDTETPTLMRCLLTHLVKVFFWTRSLSSAGRTQQNEKVRGRVIIRTYSERELTGQRVNESTSEQVNR